MIRLKHTVTPEERQALRRAAKLLNLGQVQLAEQADVRQAWVSHTFSGATANREVGNLERVAGVLLAEFQQRQATLDIDAAEKTVLLERLQKLAAISRAGDMPLESSLGRPVSVRERRFVRDDLKEKIDAHLRQNDFSLNIVGPQMSGKTSMLRYIQEEAKQRGFVTCYCSVKEIYWEGKALAELPDGEQGAAFFGWLKDTLTDEWKLDSGNETQFSTWLKNRLARNPQNKYLLVVDDLAALTEDNFREIVKQVAQKTQEAPTKSGLQHVATQFLQQTRVLRNQVGQFSVSFGVSGTETNPVIKSSFLFQQVIKVGWFSKEEVQELIEELRPEKKAQSEALAEIIFNFFGGQPFFTDWIIV